MSALESIDALKVRLDALRPLRADSIVSLMAALEVELIYSSNAIEGNSLTLRETQLVLEQGITIGGKPLKDHLEAVRLQAAWRKVLEIATSTSPVTEPEVLTLHELVLGRDDPHAGCYRGFPVFIRGARHVPPNALKVPALMEGLDAESAGGTHPVRRAARWHHGIAHIHPFAVGNGRTARLVMNLCLIRDGFPPVRILLEERLAYYEALASTDAGHETSFHDWLAEHVRRELEHWLLALE